MLGTHGDDVKSFLASKLAAEGTRNALGCVFDKQRDLYCRWTFMSLTRVVNVKSIFYPS